MAPPSMTDWNSLALHDVCTQPSMAAIMAGCLPHWQAKSVAPQPTSGAPFRKQDCAHAGMAVRARLRQSAAVASRTTRAAAPRTMDHFILGVGSEGRGVGPKKKGVGKVECAVGLKVERNEMLMGTRVRSGGKGRRRCRQERETSEAARGACR